MDRRAAMLGAYIVVGNIRSPMFALLWPWFITVLFCCCCCCSVRENEWKVMVGLMKKAIIIKFSEFGLNYLSSFNVLAICWDISRHPKVCYFCNKLFAHKDISSSQISMNTLLKEKMYGNNCIVIKRENEPHFLLEMLLFHARLKVLSSIKFETWLYDVKTSLLCNTADFHSFQVGMRNESSELSLYSKTMYLFKYCYSKNTYCSLLLSTVMSITCQFAFQVFHSIGDIWGNL